jgi:anti-sigma regulatory factor (Ser/Thr protein kinase)
MRKGSDPAKRNEIDTTLACRSHQKSLQSLKHAISDILKEFLETAVPQHLTLAIDEILQNAYEHGNLEISREEKELLVQKNLFEKVLLEREKQFGDRSIETRIKLHSSILEIHIKDQGNGFDWQKVKSDLLKTDKNLLPEISGHGLLLVEKIASSLEFKDGGRVCIFKKNLDDTY